MSYVVQYNQTITDAVMNSTGDISSWSDFLNLNNFDNWTPVLIAGAILSSPPVALPVVQASLVMYPANNASISDVYSQIDDLFAQFNYLISGAKAPVITPTVIDTNTYEEVLFGNTIGDIVMNGSGTITNWSDILNGNDFNGWTPLLLAGQRLKIPADITPNKNTRRQLFTYPANNQSVNDIYDQIIAIFDLLDNKSLWILRTGFWIDDPSLWVDTAKWID